MSEDIFYLNGDAIRALKISPLSARESVAAVFRDYAQGKNHFLPKASLDFGPGHSFQTVGSASQNDGIVVLKWISVVPVEAGSKLPGINATVCVVDFASGVPLAFLDGNEITLIRTAAMSASAAAHMISGLPQTIGMIGCGLQASAHLAAFVDLFPSLDRLFAFSRSRSSAERLSQEATRVGMDCRVTTSPEEVLVESDVTISMVPNAPGLNPFLDARLTKEGAFVAAVDLGRSWIPESFSAFDSMVTDSLAQSRHPYDVKNKAVETALFETDLVELCSGKQYRKAGRKLFCFRGLGLADHALARLVVAAARESGAGLRLPR